MQVFETPIPHRCFRDFTIAPLLSRVGLDKASPFTGAAIQEQRLEDEHEYPGFSGRQVRTTQWTCTAHGDSGAGAPAPDAAATRSGQRSEYRRVHFRLSRLAARRLRPGPMEST
ncbi:hypothetical protein D3C72_1349860 [compost metagenome]